MRESRLTRAMMMATGRIVEYHGWGVQETFSSVADEVRHLAGGVGYFDASPWGRLEVKGRDAIDLLHRLSTNDLKGIQPGDALGTILTTDKGRIEALLIVLRLDDRLLLVVPPGSEERVASWIQKYTILEDVTTRDITTETVMASLIGHNLGSMALIDLESQAEGVKRLELPWGEVLVIRVDIAGISQLYLIADEKKTDSFLGWLQALADSKGWKRTGIKAFEAYRIARGFPMTGHELTGDFNPYDVNLLDFVSFSKGCYIGQEVIARIDTYQKYRYGLRGVLLEELPDDSLLPMEILNSNVTVGWLTSSSAFSLQGYYLGLSVIRRDVHSGTSVRASGNGREIGAKVVDLPMNLESK